MTQAHTADLLKEAQAALSGVSGVKAFTYGDGGRALLALEVEDDAGRDMHALDHRGDLVLTRNGKASIRAAYAALGDAGLEVTDPASGGHESIAEGGNAEIIRPVSA
jgi:hypothetical protein